MEFEECFRPFGQIFKYLYGLQNQQSLTNPVPVDYDCILKMIPSNITFHKTQLQYGEDKEQAVDKNI